MCRNGTAAQACRPSTREAEANRFPGEEQPTLVAELEMASPSSLENYVLTKQESKQYHNRKLYGGCCLSTDLIKIIQVNTVSLQWFLSFIGVCVFSQLAKRFFKKPKFGLGRWFSGESVSRGGLSFNPTTHMKTLPQGHSSTGYNPGSPRRDGRQRQEKLQEFQDETACYSAVNSKTLPQPGYGQVHTPRLFPNFPMGTVAADVHAHTYKHTYILTHTK